MNNGRTPYGDPSQWGQQPAAGQDPAAQFVPGQYPAQAGYPQQPAGGIGYQQPYDPSWQQEYQQSGGQSYPQQPYDQTPIYQSQPYQPQTYQQQTHQPQESYAQQSWQPYAQQPYAQQPYVQQPYVQQPYAQTGGQMYQQGVQNGQPLQQSYPPSGQEPAPGVFYPAQGYSGYVSTPRKQEQSALSGEVIVKVVLFGLLPVLFVLGIVLKQPVLCWAYVAAAVVTVAAMWLRDLVQPGLRLASSLVCGVLAVVAVVTALNAGTPVQDQQTQQPGVNTLQGADAGQNNSYGTGMSLQETYTPTPTPTVTPNPSAEADAAYEQLRSFFHYWEANSDESMLALTAPSWRNSVSNPLMELFRIRANRTPLDDCEISVGGSEADTMRTAKVKVSIDKNNNREPQRYSFNVIMIKEDGAWYVDPRSLESNEKETVTTPATNPMPTQPPLNTGAPDLLLYYNPDGGSYYHIDPNCEKVGTKYKPLKGKFLFPQLNDVPYSELDNCPVCGAPLREK